MRLIVTIFAMILISGCEQSVAVPTVKDLLANPQLLTEWRAKCETGEYSQMPVNQKAEMCATTDNAIISSAQAKAAEADIDFLEANTKRK